MRLVATGLLLALAACSGSNGESSSTTSSPALPGWVELAPMTVARSEHPGVVLDEEIVVLGGLVEAGLGRSEVTASVEAYSPSDDTWRTLTDLPEPRHHGMAAVVGNRLFFIGGYSSAGEPTNTVWELTDDRWVDRAPLPGPVAAAATAVLEDSIFVVGGVPVSELYRYDPAPDRWTALSAPRHQREHVAAVALDGEIWVIAGRWQGEIRDDPETYDPDSETWRPGPTLDEARSGFGAATVAGRIVVGGGEVFSPDAALDSVEMLDPRAGVWSPIEPLPYGLHGNPLVAVGSDIYLPGGSTRAAGVENDGRTYRLSPG